MRRSSVTVTLFLVSSIVLLNGGASVHGQPSAPGRTPIVTVTRLVKLFGGLENEWLTAVRNRDEPALTALLADDFEMRLASRPSEPVPRAEWIKHALASPPVAWTVHNMAARDLGCAVMVSFRLDPGGSAPGSRPVFVVDTWAQTEGNWKVAARYVAAADERALGLPGEVTVPASLHKK